MQTDTLSEVLNAVRLSGAIFIRVNFSAPFAVTATSAETLREFFAPGSHHALPFHLVTRGHLLVDVEGGESVQLHAGDIIVLPHGATHTLRDETGRDAVHASTLEETGTPPTLVYGGGGEPTDVMCGFFHCRGRLYNPLVQSLPQVIVVRNDPERTPWLVATLQRTYAEIADERPGGAALVDRMTELLFVEVIQRYLEQDAPTGWLQGLTDPVVGSALSKIHAEPATDWTVEALAKAAAVSRSVLAERFTKLTGMSPIRYLTSWRMELAAQRLEHTADTVSQIASDVGYESEASFNRAFKRHVGNPPATWRATQQRQAQERSDAMSD